jgi:pimeloyl-ACP methyl ester carboxylesterase
VRPARGRGRLRRRRRRGGCLAAARLCLALARLWLAVACLGLAAAGCRLRHAEQPLSQSFDARGVRIHYLVLGTGEPVVLIHGLYSSAAVNWQLPGTLADLAARHRVIALDLPGHGQSDKPAGEEAYGLQMVEDVALLLDRLQIRAAHVVGYSLGGMVALRFISRHPDRVLSGVLGGMGWMQEGGAMQRVWQRPRERLRGAGSVPNACVASIGRLALTRAELLAIRVPVEVLIGDRDPVDALYVRPLQAARPDWPVVHIRRAGHLNAFLRDQFKQELARWLDQQRQAVSAVAANSTGRSPRSGSGL